MSEAYALEARARKAADRGDHVMAEKLFAQTQRLWPREPKT